MLPMGRDEKPASPTNWSMQTYHREGEEYLSATLGTHAERVNSGTTSPSRRDTCAYVYHVQSGAGTSVITTANGEVRTINWEKNNTFAVPAWSVIVHSASEDSHAYLFALSDRPLLEILHMHARDESF